ncbi:MAG: acetylglutamate kinase [Clostridia bacterium]|nr:acetylglutamate kinase [Clostridia bacterium]MBQ4249584.1 acetylglutamate kinase [Clostridia bacterium]
MSDMSLERSNTLVQAIPYIQQFRGKTIVVKYGGNAMVSEQLKYDVISDIVLLSLVGIHIVLVHGGGPEINQMLKRVGKESKFINGLRYTDAETMDIVKMVLCGKVNKELVTLIEQRGGKAMGLSGLDGNMLRAKKLSKDGVDYGFVGDITEVDPGVITTARDGGYVPIIATIAAGVDDGSAYNINADTAAAEIAVALGAEKLILLTDIKGLLRDKDDESTLIPVVRASEVDGLKAEGIISGGMIPKIDCCVTAMKNGVKRAHIIDGRERHSILVELLSDEGIGTMFINE